MEYFSIMDRQGRVLEYFHPNWEISVFKNLVRGPKNFGQEAADADIQAQAELTSLVKNFWRDYVLDREAVVLTNVGYNANPRQIMEAKIDSFALLEHSIDSFPNFMTGSCPDEDPYWENDLRCAFYSTDTWNRDRLDWRDQLDNLIKYGPLDPQTMFIQGMYPQTDWLYRRFMDTCWKDGTMIPYGNTHKIILEKIG